MTHSDIMKPLSISRLFSRLEKSLQSAHPCLQQRANPVLSGLLRGRIRGAQGVQILEQYSLLPANIVSILSAMGNRLAEWDNVTEELRRNVDEEKGTGTSGIPHFVILKRGLKRELGVNVDEVVPNAGTSCFLDGLRRAIADQTPAFVAGMAYALEDSALPELEIVALAINASARALGQCGDVIRPSAMSSRAHCEQLRATKDASNYTLEDFFVVHLQDFEVGHKKGLSDTIAEYLRNAADAADFACGFEYVLKAMDEWWEGLALLESPSAT
jgi:hypothetical protein